MQSHNLDWNVVEANRLPEILFMYYLLLCLPSCPLLKPVAKLVVSWFVSSENHLVHSFLWVLTNSLDVDVFLLLCKSEIHYVLAS